MDTPIKKALKKHRRNLSYDDAATVSEVWVIAKRISNSFYREWQDHWDERGYDEYIVSAKGHLPYCESPEEYICRMETRKEILAVLALCTAKQRERFLLYALYDFSYEEVGKICGCSKYAVRDSIKAVRKIFQKFAQNLPHD